MGFLKIESNVYSEERETEEGGTVCWEHEEGVVVKVFFHCLNFVMFFIFLINFCKRKFERGVTTSFGI